MYKVEYWVAEDGEEFDTEEACYEHEHQHDDLARKVILIDRYGNRLNNTANFKNDIEDCIEMIVDDDETAVELMDYFKYQCMESPWDRFNGLDVVAGHYYYENGWRCVESEIKELENRFHRMEKARKGV